MPSATAYRRAPLVDLFYAPLSDGAVHMEGRQERMTRQALEMADVNRMSSMDAVLATRLGGYAELPPLPDIEGAAALLPDDPKRFVERMTAATMLASMSRDREAMLRVLASMRVFLDATPALSEEALFGCGADALRLASDLYRRTGQPFLLTLLEALRARLPDVSGLMHMFPVQRDYRPETNATAEEERLYYERMRRFAMGRGAADALAMTALLAQYSGSGRDAAAPLAGLTALARYHGMPCGAFSADPYLAGRDPARAVELGALCAEIEACYDVLCFTGSMQAADRLELLWQSALPDMLAQGGVRALQPTNRLANDESCETRKPESADTSALLRALYALRRSVWLGKDDDTVAYILPAEGGCLTRAGGVPVRLTASVSGVWQKEISIRVELRQPATFTLQLRVPAYADAATVSVNGGKAQSVPQGEMHSVRRPFQNGDTVTLHLGLTPRLETGFRASASVYCGAELMALKLPEPSVAWRYALRTDLPMTAGEETGEPYVLLTACEAPSWKEKAGFILPPPQGVPAGAAYELTLTPYAGADGRIAAFPCVRA